MTHGRLRTDRSARFRWGGVQHLAQPLETGGHARERGRGVGGTGEQCFHPGKACLHPPQCLPSRVFLCAQCLLAILELGGELRDLIGHRLEFLVELIAPGLELLHLLGEGVRPPERPGLQAGFERRCPSAWHFVRGAGLGRRRTRTALLEESGHRPPLRLHAFGIARELALAAPADLLHDLCAAEAGF